MVGIRDLLNSDDKEPTQQVSALEVADLTHTSTQVEDEHHTTTPTRGTKRQRFQHLLSVFRYEPYEFVISKKDAPPPVLARVTQDADEDDIYLCHVYRMFSTETTTRGIVQFLTHGELSRGNKGHDHIRVLQSKLPDGSVYQSQSFLIKSTRAKFNQAAKTQRGKESDDNSENDESSVVLLLSSIAPPQSAQIESESDESHSHHHRTRRR
eukprot:c2828_g1_i1.p1 GENE.c2828_g1_i1~~c2828_g1_i1.p1  ORF type:complete len:210 (-),score=41.72 c2828_g1_i1:111-740(-)